MIDPRTLELIHRDADGECTPEERETLRGLLKDDPEARARRSEVAGLFHILERVEPVDPPSGMKHDILSSLPVRPERDEPERGREAVRGWWTGVFSPRFAYVFIGGLIAGLGVYHLGSTWLGPGSDIDPADVVGTMGGRAIESAEIVLVLDGTHGSLAVAGSGSATSTVFGLPPGKPVEVLVTYSEAALGFRGLDGHAGAVSALSLGDGQVRATVEGDRTYTLRFERPRSADSEVGFELRVDGTRVHAETIRLLASE